VRLEEDFSVREFVEKPSSDAVEERPSSEIDDNLISAGAYVLERDIVDMVPAGRNVSIEREVWPLLVDNGLYGFRAENYWLDIGTPDRYLRATFDIIEGNVETAVRERLGSGYLAVSDDAVLEGRAIPPAVLERGVHIGPDAHVGSLVVLGQDVTVGAGSTVERSVILNGSEIGEHCRLSDCIVSAGCRIGPGTQISRGAVLGEGVTVGAENVISNGARIFPGVGLPDGALQF
jgi:mannose-1-phosphate guanylyltransferase